MKTEIKLDLALEKTENDLFIALNHHRTHKNKPITFKHHLYMKDIYMDKNDYIVLEKGSQAGASEWYVERSINRARIGRSVFYVLPTFDLKNKFVKDRVDRTIEFTAYYKAILKQRIMKNQSESMSLKHIGKGVISYAGSNSTSAFVSFPADDLMIDELDECDQKNLNMAPERLSASENPTITKVSTPTTSDFGIDWEYNNTDKKRWMIKCECCNEYQNPNWFDNVVKEIEDKQYIIRDNNWERNTLKDINLICVKCGKPLNRFNGGQWVVTDKYNKKSGYHINKLFSTNTKVTTLMDSFEAGLKDESKLQRFYNGDLGLPFNSSGSKITYEMLNACKSDYIMPDKCERPCIIGIDVGNLLHTEIGELLPDGRTKLVFIGMLHDKEDIKELYSRYNIKFGCVDAMPESRLSKELCLLKGMYRVYYGANVKKDTIDLKNKIITVDRTTSLDSTKETILTQSIILPANADKLLPLTKEGISSFYYQMTTSTRIFDEDKQVYKWVEGGQPDHWLHSLVYLTIARKILMKAS